MAGSFDRPMLRLSAAPLLVGPLLNLVITSLHTGGEASHRPRR